MTHDKNRAEDIAKSWISCRKQYGDEIPTLSVNRTDILAQAYLDLLKEIEELNNKQGEQMNETNECTNEDSNNKLFTDQGYKALESRGLAGREADVERVKQKAAELFGLYIKLGTNEPETDAQRHYALAKTNLEQSVMWFVKGVSRSHK